MKAHVICCNDAVMYVVLNDEEKAGNIKEKLAHEDYERNLWHWNNDYKYYRHQCYWHLHDVEGE